VAISALNTVNALSENEIALSPFPEVKEWEGLLAKTDWVVIASASEAIRASNCLLAIGDCHVVVLFENNFSQ
jgi:hypothetical protein